MQPDGMRLKGRGSRERGLSECGPTEWIRQKYCVCISSPESIPLGRIPISRVPLSRILSAAFRLAAFPLGRIPSGRIPLGRIPISRCPLSRIPFSRACSTALILCFIYTITIHTVIALRRHTGTRRYRYTTAVTPRAQNVQNIRS